MKKVILLASAFVLGWLSVAIAQAWVGPFTRKDGTYVEGHYRNSPDGNSHNNWSYPRNVNPYTGKQVTGDANRYLDQYQNRNDQGYGANHERYYQYQYRW